MAHPKPAAPHPGPPPGPPRPLPENPLLGTSNKQPAVTGNSQTNIGVLGQSLGSAAGPATDGVSGLGLNGVHGQSGAPSGSGVFGENYGGGIGVLGTGSHGVHGKSGSAGGSGVLGEHSSNGTGVSGASPQGHGMHGKNGGGSGFTPQYGAGVWGESDFGYGVYGASKTNPGVQGISSGFEGVYGESQIAGHAGVKGVNNNGGFGVFGASNGWAGYFVGNVHADGDFDAGGKVHAAGDLSAGGNLTANQGSFTSDLSVLGNHQVHGACNVHGDHYVGGTCTAVVDVVVGSDCAEDFDITPSAEVEPGTVMVLTHNGELQPSEEAYDHKVAGVISGAGEYKPGLILGRRESSRLRRPLALVGKVYCKVDAGYCPIEIGDLLTTSPTPGHAMKADDPHKAFGAVIGKSLERLPSGQGLIPILIALQ